MEAKRFMKHGQTTKNTFMFFPMVGVIVLLYKNFLSLQIFHNLRSSPFIPLWRGTGGGKGDKGGGPGICLWLCRSMIVFMPLLMCIGCHKTKEVTSSQTTRIARYVSRESCKP